MKMIKHYDLPYGEKDDLRNGKSCLYNAKNARSIPLWRTNSPWTCQHFEQGTCTRLKPRGRCPPFLRKEVDEVPRVMSEWSALTSQRSHTLLYHHDGHSEYAQSSTPGCSGTLALPCFDLERCAEGKKLKVFPYGARMEEYLDYAIANTEEVLNKAEKEEDACLLVVGVGSFETGSELLASPHWNDGQNHYIFYSSEVFDSHLDRPFNHMAHFGMAATSQVSMDDAYQREGYDTPLGLFPKWKRPDEYRDLDIHRKRRLLLSFRGNIYGWEQRDWQYRWIAAEYWHNEPDVFVDVQCGNHAYEKGNSTSFEAIYEELLMNSTFFFCPGGGGTNSYRFTEVLAAGGIPVVTSDFLPPFRPEIDWRPCIIQVSDARVINIPNYVRSISDEEIRTRQINCAHLHRKVYGDDARQQQFLVAMQIWAIRVKNALARQSEVKSMLEMRS